jgi:hypothetical protein
MARKRIGTHHFEAMTEWDVVIHATLEPAHPLAQDKELERIQPAP